MALHFAMEVECGDEPTARAVASHFEGWSLPVAGTLLSCRTTLFKDSESNWWASAAPPGTSRGLPGYDNPLLQRLRSSARSVTCFTTACVPHPAFVMHWPESRRLSFGTSANWMSIF